MIEKTIQVIRETETKAESIIGEAQSKSQDIILQAKREAEQLMESQISKMKDTVANETKHSQETCAKNQEAFLAEAEQEVSALKALARSREDEAVKLIIENLTS